MPGHGWTASVSATAWTRRSSSSRRPASPTMRPGRSCCLRRRGSERCLPTLRPMSRTRRLAIVLVLNLGLVADLVAVGLSAHSVAVLAEGGDYLLDAAGVGVALLAIWLAARPATSARPGGHPNALVNAGWLLVLELLVAAAALDRLVTRRAPVDGRAVLVVSGVAALVMLAGALVLRGDEDD